MGATEGFAGSVSGESLRHEKAGRAGSPRRLARALPASLRTFRARISGTSSDGEDLGVLDALIVRRPDERAERRLSADAIAELVPYLIAFGFQAPDPSLARMAFWTAAELTADDSRHRSLAEELDATLITADARSSPRLRNTRGRSPTAERCGRSGVAATSWVFAASRAYRVLSHFATFICSSGWEISRWSRTDWNVSECGVTADGLTVGTITGASATRAV